MFDLRREPTYPTALKPVGEYPGPEVRYRAWCILPDGRVGYIHHYKLDGKFGIRPVDPDTGKHFANPSEHWSLPQRIAWPEEMAFALADIRAAASDEIPRMYRIV